MKPVFVLLTNLAEDENGVRSATPMPVNVAEIQSVFTHIETKQTYLFFIHRPDEDFVTIQESPTEAYQKIQEALYEGPLHYGRA